MSETQFAAMARTYVHSGWSVFPLWWVVGGPLGYRCACPNGAGCTSPGKHPLVRTGVNEASGDLEVVARWWQRWPMANIGVPAGDNGLAILDIDPRHRGHESLSYLIGLLVARGRTLPSTLTQTTGGGGLHMVYAAPSEGVKGGANVLGPDAPGIDTRGRGGYIVAAPSVHVSGQPYRWVEFTTEPAPWPAILSALIDPPKPEVVRSAPPSGFAEPTSANEAFLSTAAGYAYAALQGELERVRSAADGERNHTLNRAAFSLGQLVALRLLDTDAVTDALVDAAGECGLRGHEVSLTIRSGLRGGARAPREIGGAA